MTIELAAAVAYLRRRRYPIPAKDQRALRRLFPGVTLRAVYREISRARS